MSEEKMVPVSELKALAERLAAASESAASSNHSTWAAFGDAATAVRALASKYEENSRLGEVGVIVSRLVGPWHGGGSPTAQAQRTGIRVAYALADAGLLALPEWEMEAVRLSRLDEERKA